MELTTAQIARRWKTVHRTEFEGTVRIEHLKPVSNIRDFDPSVPYTSPHAYYICPSCGKNSGHYASVSQEGSGMSDVLHCWETGRQWLIITDIMGIVRGEEEKFAALLDKWSHMEGKSVTALEAFNLSATHGVPPDMLDIDDQEEFDRLMDKHKEISATARIARRG